MGGGGGGGSQGFTAQGAPPNYDYQNAMGAQQMAIGGDIQSYSLSDQDFANRYPQLQQAYQNYQGQLNQQTQQVGAGAAGQADIMNQLGNTITGRNAAGTTSDIGNIQSAAATAAQATQPIYNLGASQAGLAQPLIGMGQQQAGLANPLMQDANSINRTAGQMNRMGTQQGQIGNQINTTGQGVTGMAATPYATGQQLLNEPIDPQTQQQMMRAGLGSAAGSLGAASLGQGMAGQSAAARQLGLSTLQYGQAMRGEAMSDIGQAASIAGQGGQLQGLGASTIAGGANTKSQATQATGLAGQTTGLAGSQIAQGAQTIGLGGSQLASAANTYNTGATSAATAGGLSAQAQSAQEQYGMDTAQMASTYGTLQNQQAMNQMLNMQTSGQLFQKRPFGLGGTSMAQDELGQAGAYNSFQQANYATMNGIAFNGAQMNAQNQQAQAAQSAGMVSAGVGAAGAAASAAAAAAAISCWVAREAIPEKWQEFRIWMLNFAPTSFRSTYLRHGRRFAAYIATRPALKEMVRGLMLAILDARPSSLLTLNTLLTA